MTSSHEALVDDALNDSRSRMVDTRRRSLDEASQRRVTMRTVLEHSPGPLEMPLSR